MGEELSDNVTLDISELINKGKFKPAAALGDKHKDDRAVNGSAHFRFQYGLALEQSGRHKEAEAQFELAKTSDGFTQQMQGDMYRGLALARARAGDFMEAHALLAQAEEIFQGDENRLASVEMFRARVYDLEGDYAAANYWYGRADIHWKRNRDKADPQWVMNNRFYWMKNRASARWKFKWLYREFVNSPESRRDRHILAWLYRHFGRFGVRIGNLLEGSTLLRRFTN